MSKSEFKLKQFFSRVYAFNHQPIMESLELGGRRYKIGGKEIKILGLSIHFNHSNFSFLSFIDWILV
jgi:hypothetical protein